MLPHTQKKIISETSFQFFSKDYANTTSNSPNTPQKTSVIFPLNYEIIIYGICKNV
jgi:hypothetical protein